MLEDRLELLFFLDLQATRQENEGAQHKNESNAGHPPKFGQIPQAPLPPPPPRPRKNRDLCSASLRTKHQ